MKPYIEEAFRGESARRTSLDKAIELVDRDIGLLKDSSEFKDYEKRHSFPLTSFILSTIGLLGVALSMYSLYSSVAKEKNKRFVSLEDLI